MNTNDGRIYSSTEPKPEMANAAQEAADCIAAGGGYSRREAAHNHNPPRPLRPERGLHLHDDLILPMNTTLESALRKHLAARGLFKLLRKDGAVVSELIMAVMDAIEEVEKGKP